MSSPADALELRATVESLCRTDFGVFAHRAFYELEGHQLDLGYHLDIIAAFAMLLEACEERRAVICMPPRYLKTNYFSIFLMAWILGRNSRARLICCSYGIDLAEKFSSDTLRLMRTSFYRRVFPNTVISKTKQGKTEFATTAGGYRFATSVGGTMTGRGADYIIVDDPLKASEAHSPTARQSSIDWFNSSVRSRLNNPSKGVIVVVSQRLHAEDLPGHLLEAGGWTPLILPAINPKKAVYEVRKGLLKVRFEAGRVLQPARHSLEDLQQLKKEMGELDFEAQYNQCPLPPGGATFKAQWIKRYDAPPAPAKIQAIVQSWDTAYEGAEHNDYSVCTTWAMCPDGFYLLDVWRDRPAFWELEKAVYSQRTKWKAELVMVERAGSGISLIQCIRERDQHLWLHHVKPEGAKMSRAQQHTPKFEQGKIWLPSHADWLAAYENELFAFPYGKHDDQVDSTTQFLAAADKPQLVQAIYGLRKC